MLKILIEVCFLSYKEFNFTLDETKQTECDQLFVKNNSN